MKHFPSPACRWLVLILSVWINTGCGGAAPVRTPKRPVVNEYHGVKVADDYQWLENGQDPAVQKWTEAQNQYARSVLDKPLTRTLVERRLRQLHEERPVTISALAWRSGRFFALRSQPPAQQAALVRLWPSNSADQAQVVLDPGTIEPRGTMAIDWFVPSPDGKLVVVSLSQHGSEEGSLHFFETATGRKLDDVVPRAQFPTGGGSAAWNAAGSGVFYTRYPQPGERTEAEQRFYQQVYFHRLGTVAEQDAYEIGREFPRIAETKLERSPDGRYLLATVANGDGGEFAHYLREPAGRWRQVTTFADGITRAEFGRDPLYIEWGRDDGLYLLAHQKAPFGKIVRVPLANPVLTNAVTVFPEGTNVVRDFKPTASGLCVVLLDGGPEEFYFVDHFEKKLRGPAFKTPTAVQQVVVSHGDEVFYRTVSYVEPVTWWRYDANKDKDRVEALALSSESPVDFGDVEAVRASATSRDGTKVPLTIVRKKGTRLNGENPVILSGYGGYGISLTPNFDFTRRVWLDQGGVFAIANLRGGGEFGEAWHHAGNLTKKQNVFDDFVACAEFLVRSNYTKPEKLALQGGSNGGLLMGATLTQRPDLARAVVSHVGIYDMLRVERDANGQYNVPEFGSVQQREQFDALYAYSPYHHVTNRVNYPATLLLTGAHDGRVNPAHSRKLAARLQAATAGRRPVLLRTSASSGHGMGTALDERVAQLADVYTFLLEQLGVDYSVVDRGPWSGALTPTTATVKARLVQDGVKARLAVSKSPLFRSPQYTPPQRAEAGHYNVVEFDLSRLQPDTRYYYALEVDGRLDRAKRGELRTFPAGPASFRIAFASCARTASTSDVFDRIRENQPLFYMNMGDFHYLNIQTNLRSRFRAAYDTVLASPQQADLYRHVPFVYIWDDHDFGGNNSNRRASSHEAARLTYEEYVPHYPLAAGDGDVPIYQSFNVGRVKFILTDLRSERDSVTNKDNATKSMMGAKQKEWFKQELLSANGKYPLICWVSSVPWLGEAGTNYYRAVKTNQFGYIHHTNLVMDATTRTNRNRALADEDHWSMFATERRELADFIKSNHISGVCILHGDSHMLAADDGSHGDYATGGGAPIPVMCAAPLDQEPSLKGGLYSQGVYRVKKGEGCFGLLTVTDAGDRIDVAYSGRNNQNDEKISLKFSVPATPPGKKR